ncbi:hypothetical protein C8Q74DRAFT_510375 [Fomes fomentarius]|nr:hypothetical protein C8Q74DRAFT_510375 [Fomes fomentarius]
MSSPDDIKETISLVGSNFALQCCTVAAAAVLVYDTLLTFRAEVTLIWRRRIGIMTVLYFANRYIELAAFVPTLALLFPVSDTVRPMEHIRRHLHFDPICRLGGLLRHSSVRSHWTRNVSSHYRLHTERCIYHPKYVPVLTRDVRQ